MLITSSGVSASGLVNDLNQEVITKIPFQIVKVDSPDLYVDKTVVSQVGVEGVSKQIIDTKTLFGKTFGAKECFAVVTLPVDEIDLVGTKQYPTMNDNTGKLILPCHGEVTSTDKPGAHAGYTAVDIADSMGSPLYAPCNGIITMAEAFDGYGNCLQMSSGEYSFLFGHLSSFNCEVGQQVSKGDIVGYMGSTGDSTGSHLHLEVYIDGVKQYIPDVFNLEMGDVV